MAVKGFRRRVFPLLAGGLWAVFLFLDLTRLGDSTAVKFAAICLCCAAAWTGCRTADGRRVTAALTLTVGADVFLLLLDRGLSDRLLGVGLFLAVQLLYALRLYRLRRDRVCRWGAALRLGALALALLLFLAPIPEEVLPAGVSLPLTGLSLLYFSNLCANTLEAFAGRFPAPLSRFAPGLALFVGCDVCVGAWNLGLRGFARVGMWLFYVPSQVLIVLSQDTEGDHL